jgi:hypothetical protein
MKPFLSLLLFGLIGFSKAQSPSYNLTFNPKNYVVQTLTHEGKTFKVRAYENLVYVKNPVDTAYQKMNIYIPEEYFMGKSIHGYTAKTVPIFFPNKVGGYMPALPATTKDNPMGNMPPINGGILPTNAPRPEGMPSIGLASPKPLTIVVALSKGYIVASAGARGRTSKDKNSIYTGKAPAGLVDLKAAIRYLKFNDKKMPGNANKIISNGTSAGGAMSALLGATGNNPDYEPYLEALGAAKAKDDVFAVSAYCPITNLDHADMAYEWQFNGINTYKKGGPMAGNNPQASSLNEKQIEVSAQLKDLFPAYLNSLKLKDSHGNLLTLESDGNGNFKDWVKSYVIASAQKALDDGTDLSSFTFLTILNGKITQIDYDAYIRYMERQKTPPAFDALDLSSAENMLFGTATTDKQHFTDFSTNNSTLAATTADKKIVKMMNPMNYIGQPNTTTSKHWRIRHGAKDKDTGLAISVILATQLQNKGYHVNLALPWGKPHSGDYDLKELFEWIDGICK